jgi:hypothetical protein
VDNHVENRVKEEEEEEEERCRRCRRCGWSFGVDEAGLELKIAMH